MKMSELAKQTYAFENVVREVFNKCRGIEIGSHYDFYKYEFRDSERLEITGYDYRCGGDYDSFFFPISALDDVDSFISKRKIEVEEEK